MADISLALRAYAYHGSPFAKNSELTGQSSTSVPKTLRVITRDAPHCRLGPSRSLSLANLFEVFETFTIERRSCDLL